MTAPAEPHHDSAAWLEVHQVRPRYHLHLGTGWYVRRICACHYHDLVSVRFATEAEAEHCRQVLDQDCRLRLAQQARG